MQQGSHLMDVWIYSSSDKEGGGPDRFKAFESKKEADLWLAKHNPEGVASEYSPKTSKDKIELKDWLIIVPAAGSAIAVIYEIGSFLPLGGAAFGLFSLSDHLLWALQALPVAMGLVAGILMPMTIAAVVRKPLFRT
jgi:hypothetical protein